MSARGQFFIIFFITCILISVLFFLAFRHTDTPLLPYSYLSKTAAGLPGMDRKPMRKSKSSKHMNKEDNTLGKPLPEPTLPKPPVPLIAKVAPPGPPLRKPMMT